MNKKKSKRIQTKFKQLDIESAFEGKDKFIEDSSDDEVVTERSSNSFSPFDFVSDIRKSKSGKLMDSESGAKSFNKFMILRVLSMNNLDVGLCNILNQYQNLIPDKAMYEALLGLIEKDYRYHSYIKPKGNKQIHFCTEFVAKYYEIPIEQAQTYIELMGEEWALDIKNNFGGDSTIQ